MPITLPTQVEAVVFDGVTPAYRDLRTPHAAIFPWLISFTAINGGLVDMSGTAAAGTATIGWTAKWVITSATATVLTVLSSTATAGGSQISFPNAAGGQLQVLGSLTDMAALSGFLEHTLYVTDQFLNQYKAVYGMVYPCLDTG